MPTACLELGTLHRTMLRKYNRSDPIVRFWNRLPMLLVLRMLMLLAFGLSSCHVTRPKGSGRRAMASTSSAPAGARRCWRALNIVAISEIPQRKRAKDVGVSGDIDY